MECFRCGICCQRYQPRVTQKEVKKIAAALGMANDEFLSSYVQTTPQGDAFLLQSSGQSCIFLRGGRRTGRATCAIYSVRPKASRDWIPSLSRPECREGLAKLKPKEAIVTPQELFPSHKVFKWYVLHHMRHTFLVLFQDTPFAQLIIPCYPSSNLITSRNYLVTKGTRRR